jgi:hypothetical protein
LTTCPSHSAVEILSYARPDCRWRDRSDLHRAADYYRRLGVHLPQELDPKGTVMLRRTFQEICASRLTQRNRSVRSIPSGSPPSGGHRVAVAFRCESPDEVDRLYRELIEAGAQAQRDPWNAFLGPAIRAGAGSRRERCRPVRATPLKAQAATAAQLCPPEEHQDRYRARPRMREQGP